MIDLLNECEWDVLDFSTVQLICFESLPYWGYTLEEILTGKGHVSFELNLN